jgi:cyclic pyranopterin phosphate synthase
MNIKDHIRKGLNDIELTNLLLSAFGNRAKDGWEAEHNRLANHPAHESMATIGG